MPQNMRDLFASLVPAIFQTDAGNAAFKIAFDIESLQAVNDGDFRDFHVAVEKSGESLELLLNK